MSTLGGAQTAAGVVHPKQFFARMSKFRYFNINNKPQHQHNAAIVALSHTQSRGNCEYSRTSLSKTRPNNPYDPPRTISV